MIKQPLKVHGMNKKLRNAVKKAEKKLNEASYAVQSIEPHLVFCSFGKILPQVSAYDFRKVYELTITA